ncbi:MAG: DNA cytosine methyltransferase [Candidatus Cryptobacteroides sp.]|nr:DNA cytosine methyltransferase [Candidatus Cryptobacteroides sp.]
MRNIHADIQNTKANIDSQKCWMDEVFSFPDRTIRLATSFSGIGAIEQAFKRLGLKHIIQFAGDIDENCRKSYFANYEITPERWHSDIHSFDARPFYGQVDLFVGGAPCQAFSMRGKRGGFEDTRGTLFREFARVVIECQPKVFIFENVKGMLSHDGGNTWRTIKKTFENDCGYDVYYQVLNGKDYGVPQSRERIYCIGFKKETEFSYPSPIPLDKTMYDYLDRKFDFKYFLKRKGVSFITESVNHQKSYTQINGTVQLCQKRNQQFNWHGDFVFHPALKSEVNAEYSDETLFDIDDFEEKYFIHNTDSKYAVHILDEHTVKMSGADESEIDKSKGRYRKLTPRECLRLMGFSDDFKIVVSDTETYKQSGNSIIVDVLIALLKQIDITKYGI